MVTTVAASKMYVVDVCPWTLLGELDFTVSAVAPASVSDVAVDLRRSSPTFGQWHGATLSGENKLMFWIPTGLAHGFRVISEGSHVLYKSTDFYHPECERTLAWNDPDMNVDWRLEGAPIISAKDALGLPFREAETFE